MTKPLDVTNDQGCATQERGSTIGGTGSKGSRRSRGGTCDVTGRTSCSSDQCGQLHHELADRDRQSEFGRHLAITGTFSGNFTINKNLTLLGSGTAVLNGHNSRTTLIVSSGATAALNHMTVTGGNASGSGQAADGGGIRNFGTLTLAQRTVNNSAGGSGGGIFNDSSAALTLKQTTVSGNTATVDGGGIYNNGMMTLTGSAISNNSATYSGGGIFNCCGFESVTLQDTRISNNSAYTGGCLFNMLDNVTLDDSSVSGNTAKYEAGGINNNAGNTTLRNSTVNNNTAKGGAAGTVGGGVYTFSGTVSLDHSNVRSNTPDNCAPTGYVDGCTG
jgi:predicted outer membrane repeat protein